MTLTNMDTNTTLLSTTTGTTILGILILAYRSVNGKRLRSSCCGRKVEMDFKVDEMPATPPPEIIVENPQHKILVQVK